MNQLYDKAGKPIKITIVKPQGTIPMSQLFEEICEKLREPDIPEAKQ